MRSLALVFAPNMLASNHSKQVRQLPTRVLLCIIKFIDDDIATLSALSRASPLLKNIVAYSLSKKINADFRAMKFPVVKLYFNQENKWFGTVELQCDSVSVEGKCVMKPTSASQNGMDFMSSTFISAPTLNNVRVNRVAIPFASANRKLSLKEGQASMTIRTDSKLESDLISMLIKKRHDVSLHGKLMYTVEPPTSPQENKRHRHLSVSHFECDIGFLHYVPEPEPKTIQPRMIARRAPPPSYEQLPSYESALSSPRVIV